MSGRWREIPRACATGGISMRERGARCCETIGHVRRHGLHAFRARARRNACVWQEGPARMACAMEAPGAEAPGMEPRKRRRPEWGRPARSPGNVRGRTARSRTERPRSMISRATSREDALATHGAERARDYHRPTRARLLIPSVTTRTQTPSRPARTAWLGIHVRRHARARSRQGRAPASPGNHPYQLPVGARVGQLCRISHCRPAEDVNDIRCLALARCHTTHIHTRETQQTRAPGVPTANVHTLESARSPSFHYTHTRAVVSWCLPSSSAGRRLVLVPRLAVSTQNVPRNPKPEREKNRETFLRATPPPQQRHCRNTSFRLVPSRA